LTEQEAISTLQLHFVSAEGFVARLQRGEGIDHEGVEQVRAALDALAALWADRAEVPRHATVVLVDVETPIIECASQYPELTNELWQLASDLVTRIERIFYTYPGMTEEEAVAIVYGHLRGISGIALTFHHREPIYDLEWATDLLTALDTLAVAWSAREEAPKAVIGPMLDARAVIRGHADNYPQWQSQLEQIGDEVAERVRRCLSS
jgi:hypothetical protein